MTVDKSLSEKILAVEKNLSLYRVITVFSITALYFVFAMPSPPFAWLGHVVLGIGCVYCLALWALDIHKRLSAIVYITSVTLIEGLLMPLWLLATGGTQSPYFPLYIVSLFSSAFRLDQKTTYFLASYYAVGFLALLPWSGPIAETFPEALMRVGFLFLTAAIGNIQSQEGFRQIRAKLQALKAVRNIGRRTRVERAALTSSEQRFKDLVENLNAVIWEGNFPLTQYTFVSQRAETLLGYLPQTWLEDSSFWIQRIHPEDRKRIESIYDSLGDDPRDVEIEYRGHSADGRILWLHEIVHVVQNNQGKPIGTRGMIVDISRRKQAEEKIRHQLTHDELTGLPNRNFFVESLALALTKARQYKNQVAVIIFDMDRFKNIKDTLGYAFGDKILKAVARRIEGRLEEQEVLARLGGDEFAILIPTAQSSEDTGRRTQNILDALDHPIGIDNMKFHITITAGIGIFPGDGDDMETLLKNASTSLYEAKKVGRKVFQFYSPSMNAKAFQQLELENSLRSALTNDEFVIYYQPQIDSKSNKIIGLEALVRWQHPDRGLLAPSHFITMAEKSGLIVPIGEWVLRQACVQFKKWQTLGLDDMRLYVNLSPLQMQQKDLPGMVARALKDSALDSRLLGLEITESAAMQNIQHSIKILTELDEMGIHMCLDDFGTGYSSLTYLKLFPIKTLKIDKSFVRDLVSDPTDAAIANAVISMAQNLNLKVVAEGVENLEQLAFLKANNCFVMQGFLFSHPLPADEIEPLLKKGTIERS